MADTPEEVFGISDGMISVIGVILGLLSASRHTILAGAVGLAVASSVSMGAGEWLSDRSENLRKAATMAAATFAGTLVPIVPFLIFPKPEAIGGAAILAVGVAVWIAQVRSRLESRARAYGETFAILASVVAVTLAVTLLTGVGG